jgi:hypothetical protein
MSGAVDWSWIGTLEGVETFGAVGEHVVEEAEARVGRFPPEYREFVLSVGAARIGHRDVLGLHPTLPPYLDVAKETLFERTTPRRPLPIDLIAVFNDGAGNLYCVRADVGDGESGRDAVLAWWRDDESPPEHVDESFAGWLRSLSQPDEE